MCKCFIFRCRGRGAVVVMASSAADTPAAEIAVYGATKVKAITVEIQVAKLAQVAQIAS